VIEATGVDESEAKNQLLKHGGVRMAIEAIQKKTN